MRASHTARSDRLWREFTQLAAEMKAIEQRRQEELQEQLIEKIQRLIGKTSSVAIQTNLSDLVQALKSGSEIPPISLESLAVQDGYGDTLLRIVNGMREWEKRAAFLAKCPEFSEALLAKENLARETILHEMARYPGDARGLSEFLKKCPMFSEALLTKKNVWGHTPLQYVVRYRKSPDVLAFLQHCQAYPYKYKEIKGFFNDLSTRFHNGSSISEVKDYVSILLNVMRLYLNSKQNHRDSNTEVRMRDFSKLLETLLMNKTIQKSTVKSGFFSDTYKKLCVELILVYANEEIVREAIRSDAWAIWNIAAYAFAEEGPDDFLAQCPNFSEATLMRQRGDGKTLVHHAAHYLRGDNLAAFLAKCPNFSEELLMKQDENGNTALHYAVDYLHGDDLAAFLAKCPMLSEALLAQQNKGRHTVLHKVARNLIGTSIPAFLAKCAPFSEKLLLMVNEDGYTPMQLAVSFKVGKALIIFLRHCVSYAYGKIENLLSFHDMNSRYCPTDASTILNLMRLYLVSKKNHGDSNTIERIRDFYTLLNAMENNENLPESSIKSGYRSDTYNNLRKYLVEIYNKTPELMKPAINSESEGIIALNPRASYLFFRVYDDRGDNHQLLNDETFEL